MSFGEPWWVLSRDVQEPTAWWLGIFHRALTLKPSTPSLLFVPTVRGSNPRSLDCEVAAPEATVLIAETSSPAAQNILTSDIIPASTDTGSVTLAGVPADERAVLRRFAKDTPENRLWDRLKLREPDAAPVDQRISLAKRLAYVLKPPTDLLISPLGPLEWHGTLFPYQVEGVQVLLSRHALLLADDMGLGKTIQAVAALRILAIQRRMEAALVIVPASLLAQWRKEIRTWAPELRTSTIHGPAPERAYQWSAPAHVYLTTYETLRSDFTDNPASPPRKRIWDVVILDEAQKIKNRDAEVSRKCKLLTRRRAWALTGTPLENRLDDLASILEFVYPFHEGESPVRLLPDSRLLERHRNLRLRRKKTEVLTQLPPKTTSHIVLPLTDSQSETYKRAEEQGILQLREMGEEVRVENVLELILRLKQICNFCPRTGQSAKLDDIRERLSTLEAEGHRGLIFSQFTDPQFGVDAIASGLEDFRPLRYTGALSSPQRQAVIQAFKMDRSRTLLVLSLRAGGQGLNLQEASYVFHFDRWWNPAVEHQAEDRSHRLGQFLPVHVYKYTCEGTIEERIEQILQRKQSLFDEVVDDVSIDLKAHLSAEELFSLFSLTPPASARTPSQGGDALQDYTRMTGPEFEGYVKGLLERRGWRVEKMPPTRDGGIDLIATRAVDVIDEITLYIQCKNYASPAGVEVVRQLNGVLPILRSGSRGVVACPSGFTADARSFARDRGISLWDRAHLVELSQSVESTPRQPL
jgi:HJR/Mrr/RecB family endonuclease